VSGVQFPPKPHTKGDNLLINNILSPFLLPTTETLPKHFTKYDDKRKAETRTDREGKAHFENIILFSILKLGKANLAPIRF
jgi:hypothetical protein